MSAFFRLICLSVGLIWSGLIGRYKSKCIYESFLVKKKKDAEVGALLRAADGSSSGCVALSAEDLASINASAAKKILSR